MAQGRKAVLPPRRYRAAAEQPDRRRAAGGAAVSYTHLDVYKRQQYTGGFDRATGGDSYEDTKASGHTDAPAFDSEIRNWEGKSMYSCLLYTSRCV